MILNSRMSSRLIAPLTLAALTTLATAPAFAGANRMSLIPPSCIAEGNGFACQGTMSALRALQGDATAFAQFAADSWGLFFMMRIGNRDHFCIAPSSMAAQWQMAVAGNAAFKVMYNSAGECTYAWVGNGSGFKNPNAL